MGWKPCAGTIRIVYNARETCLLNPAIQDPTGTPIVQYDYPQWILNSLLSRGPNEVLCATLLDPVVEPAITTCVSFLYDARGIA